MGKELHVIVKSLPTKPREVDYDSFLVPLLEKYGLRGQSFQRYELVDESCGLLSLTTGMLIQNVETDVEKRFHSLLEDLESGFNYPMLLIIDPEIYSKLRPELQRMGVSPVIHQPLKYKPKKTEYKAATFPL